MAKEVSSSLTVFPTYYCNNSLLDDLPQCEIDGLCSCLTEDVQQKCQCQNNTVCTKIPPIIPGIKHEQVQKGIVFDAFKMPEAC